MASSWTWCTDCSIPSEAAAGKSLVTEILSQLAANDWCEREIFGVHLAMEEALVNAIKHGNCLDASKRVHVKCQISPDCFWVEIRDEGAGFDPGAVPDCTDACHLEIPSGRGVLLMRSFMSKVEYNGQGNCVQMMKERCDEPPAE